MCAESSRNMLVLDLLRSLPPGKQQGEGRVALRESVIMDGFSFRVAV